MNSPIHDQMPGRKVPSRNGGLRTVQCSCGWESGPESIEARDEVHEEHVQQTAALRS